LRSTRRILFECCEGPGPDCLNLEIDGPGNAAVNRIKKGQAKLEVQNIVAVLPTFARFALDRGVDVGTIRNWRAKYPAFDEALSDCEGHPTGFIDSGPDFRPHTRSRRDFRREKHSWHERPGRPVSTGRST
jgi:hypothetical protein